MASTKISKDAPGGAPGGLYWEEAGDIVEVVDRGLAAMLLKIPGFTEVRDDVTAELSKLRTPVEETDQAAKKRTAGRKPNVSKTATPVTTGPARPGPTGVPAEAESVTGVNEPDGKTLAAEPSSGEQQSPVVAPDAAASDKAGARTAAASPAVAKGTPPDGK